MLFLLLSVVDVDVDDEEVDMMMMSGGEERGHDKGDSTLLRELRVLEQRLVISSHLTANFKLARSRVSELEPRNFFTKMTRS